MIKIIFTFVSALCSATRIEQVNQIQSAAIKELMATGIEMAPNEQTEVSF